MMTDPNADSAAPDSIPCFCLAADDILDSLQESLIVVDRDRTIRYRNAVAAARLPKANDIETTFAGAQFLGRFEGWATELARIFDSADESTLECALRPSIDDPPVLLTLRCTALRQKGTQRVTGAVIFAREGIVEKDFEERLEISKRLTSLGRLATRVAHELNNPLDGILRYVNLALRKVSDSSEPALKSYLAESRTGLMRMVQIIGDLLEFSRTTDGEFDEMDINEVIEQSIRTNEAVAKARNVIVAADFRSANMPSVCGSRLYQVCCNLIRNALDAMPDGGRLSITSGLVADNVVIRVADTGVGLPEPVDKVFEPFFTTKERGKGSGLGLAICKDFVEDMQGTVTASPSEDRGAVFTVRIPVSSFRTPSRLGGSMDYGRSSAAVNASTSSRADEPDSSATSMKSADQSEKLPTGPSSVDATSADPGSVKTPH